MYQKNIINHKKNFKMEFNKNQQDKLKQSILTWMKTKLKI